MKKLAGIVCMILSLAMVFTMSAGSVVSAADEHSIALSYDSSLGTVEINPTEPIATATPEASALPEPTATAAPSSEYPYSIDKAEFGSSGALDLSLSYHGGETAPTAVLMIAAYDKSDESVLLDQKMYNISGTEIADYDGYTNPNGGTVKVYVWKDAAAITPLAEAVTVSETHDVTLSADDNTWTPTATLTAGTAYEIISGITLTTAEDYNYNSSKATIDGVQYTGAIKGSNNGSVSESGMSGCAMRFDVQRTGTISVAINMGAGKGAKACSVNDIDNLLLDYKNSDSSAVNVFVSFDVVAGESYYFWPSGTKPNIFGVKFEEKITVPMQTGETVRVVSTPGSDALVGKVTAATAAGESIDLTQNSDMTECVFTMPDADVNVDVEFLSNAVLSQIESLSFDEIKGDNTDIDHVNSDLKLFDGSNTYIGYADVKWESSDTDTISISGEVNTSSTEKKVDFTAVYTYQDYPSLKFTKTFHITVPADTDDAGAVAEAKAALTLGDTSAVKTDIELTDRGKRSTTITWTSSDTEVVSIENGTAVVHRAAGEDKTATLTATISRNGVSDTKTFEITVLGYVAVSIDRIALSNSSGEVVMSPADGVYVSHILYVDSIPDEDRTGKEILNVEVYNSAQTEVTDSCTFYLSAIVEDTDYTMNYDQTVLYTEGMDGTLPAVPASGAAKLPAEEGSVIKVTALSDDSGDAVVYDTYTYDVSISGVPTVYVTGDSTACTYANTGSNNRFPQTGWAMVLQDFFDTSDVVVSDLALSGRSSLNFLTESNYTKIKNNIKTGDYLIVQFGHNDEKDDSDRHTDPTLDRFHDGTNSDGTVNKSFKKNLTDNYINLAYDKGAYPILTTSISRRGGGPYNHPVATRELSKELGVPCVDLYAKVDEYINRVGKEQAKDIYNYVKAHDSRFVNCSAGEFTKSQFYAAGTTDNTHINYYGAQMISQWFSDELTRIGHPLAGKRNSHTMTEEEIPSYADATSVD